MAKKQAPKRRFRPLRMLAKIAVVALAPPVALTALYRIVPPPFTPLMAIRAIEGDGARRDWVALEAVAPAVPLAIIAAEDNKFCDHVGFDFGELRAAVEEWRAGGRLRGASTITMQVSRNLFLWPGGGFARKTLEAVWTPFLELLLGKRRIMEIYLNVAETGRGLFGVEAAAQEYFGRSAAGLSPDQAARLAAILPNPRTMSAGTPSEYVRKRARTIAGRARDIAPAVDCLN